MHKRTVKFNSHGKWSDLPSDPIIKVKPGDIVTFTAETAKIAVEANKAEYYEAPAPEKKDTPDKEKVVTPATKDKEKAKGK